MTRSPRQPPPAAGREEPAACRARVQRDLELLAMEITTAEEHLDELRRKQDQLRAIAIAGGD